MTSKERIIAALHRQEVDRLPFSPLLDDFFVAGLAQQGYSFDLLEAMKYIGCDIMMRHVPSYKIVMKNVNVRDEREGDRVIQILETPVGDLRSSTIFSKGTFFIEEHPIKTVQDIETMTYVAEHTDYIPQFDVFHEWEKRIGDSGIATAEGILSPIMDFIQFGAGLLEATYLFADYEEQTDTLLQTMHERNKRCFRILRDLNCQAVIAYEDTSTTMLNERWLLDYELKAVNDYAEIMRGCDSVYITHMCGKLNGFKQHISKFESDGIDSLCPPTTGDLCLWDARDAFPEKVLIGGIEPPALVRMDCRQTLEYVVDFINRMPDKRGVILSTGDATPNGTPINNLKTVVRMLELLGKESLGTSVNYSVIDRVLADSRT